MKLKENEEYAGIDIIVAIVILMLFLPTITGAIYNVRKNNMSINSMTTSIRLATTILETDKGTDYDDITLNSQGNTGFLSKVQQKIEGQITGNENKVSLDTTPTDSNENYKITNTLTSDINRKNIKVEVMYPIGKNQKTIDISTDIYQN